MPAERTDGEKLKLVQNSDRSALMTPCARLECLILHKPISSRRQAKGRRSRRDKVMILLLGALLAALELIAYSYYSNRVVENCAPVVTPAKAKTSVNGAPTVVQRAKFLYCRNAS